MKIVTVLGTRPNFIKAYLISQELKRKNIQEVIIHTGQHYDYKMSEIFFKDLGIPKPDYTTNLKGTQINEMTIKIREIIAKEHPQMVLVYGDTNSTLAGAIAAFREGVPIAHVEGGVRSFNLEMAEERNRIIIDHYSALSFTPNELSKKNLENESKENVYFTGDVLNDSVLHNLEAIKEKKLYKNYGVVDSEYYIMTLHRQETVDVKENLEGILETFKDLKDIIFPIHPRTKQNLTNFNLLEAFKKKFILIDPLTYLDMLSLVYDSKLVLTDSGGIQKEAYFLHIPCVALMDLPVVPELVDLGWNMTVGLDREKIRAAIRSFSTDQKYLKNFDKHLYGEGKAHSQIVNLIETYDTAQK